MPDFNATTYDAVLAVVRSLGGSHQTIDEDTRLTSLGFDSMGVVQLIVEIEGSLHVTFREDDLTPAAFSTIGSLVGAVERADASN